MTYRELINLLSDQYYQHNTPKGLKSLEIACDLQKRAREGDSEVLSMTKAELLDAIKA